MAIKHGSKVDKSFSASSMTDLMFLLLLPQENNIALPKLFSDAV